MREVVVTGVGLVSCVGEGVEAHLAALRSGPEPRIDGESFAPFAVHPAVPLDWDKQIPKKSEQRQMENWQRLGVYAAGLALDSAAAQQDPELKRRMHLLVAAGGGERDYAVDAQILSALPEAEDKAAFLNERLMNDLRPTLLLVQLPNLLAGSISIVHGVTAGSRSLMGEEQSGVEALRIAHARIAAGEADAYLVGGAYNAERPDAVLLFALGGFLWKQPFRSVWDRPEDGGGFILGSGAAFLVLEAREHAHARGAKALATLAKVVTERTRRQPGDVGASLRRMWRDAGVGADAAVISGATGVAGITAEERAALDELAPAARAHATGDLVGHTIEGQAPFGVALAAASIAAGDSAEAVITSFGHRRGEGLIRLTRAG
jgi:3-oxoacyl-[acyl-carrier-protein] synthase II